MPDSPGRPGRATPVPGALPAVRQGDTNSGIGESGNETVPKEACPACGGFTPTDLPFCQHCGQRKFVRQKVDQKEGWAGLERLLPDGTTGEVVRVRTSSIEIGGPGSELEFDGVLVGSPHVCLQKDPDGSVTVAPLAEGFPVFIRVEQIRLSHGDEILLGREVFRFETVHFKKNTEHLRMGGPNRKVWGRLVAQCENGEDRDVRYLSDDEVTIGREDGTILIPDDDFLSRTHACIRGPDPELVDLESSNGSFFRVRGPHAVVRGSTFRFGDVILRLTD